MRINGKYKKAIGSDDGDIEVTFSIANYHQREILKKLKQNRDYSLEIKPIKDSRSIQQNRYMWALLKDIAEEMNNDKDDTYIYCLALERANVKSEILCCDKQAEKLLKQRFRAVKYVRDMKDNDNFGVYQVYPGSSTMNTKEMSELIDCILDIANEVGIETSFWESVLK